MSCPAWLTVFQRTFPSANMALVHGPRPILVDTGFGSDFAVTDALLRDAGVASERLALIVNTHYHSDHVGGNYGFQTRYGLPIAAHRWDAGAINRRDREACAAEWLDQPIEPYTITQPLSEGDTLDTGRVTLQTLHTPGHTLGHLSLYSPTDGVLIAGDVFHSDDVAWLNPFREGSGAIERALESLARLARLPLTWAVSGHGPPMATPLRAIDAARRRYEGWLSAPEKAAWHGAKRIFAFHLMLRDGMAQAEVGPYLLQCAWFQDYARHVFDCEPADFVAPFLAEMLRSGAAEWRAGQLVALTPYNARPLTWATAPTRPRAWPPAGAHMGA
ncbi:MAG: MBL fold metallo-hydrolase [Anaerolineae bacterium]